MQRQYISIILILLLTACSSAQITKSGGTDMMTESEKLVAPAAGYGMIYVVRSVEVQSQARFTVYLDRAEGENLIGHTLGGQYINFPATPGEHILYSAGTNMKSIKLDVKEGETIFVRQRVRVDPRDATNQEPLEIIAEEAGQAMLKSLSKGWMNEREA